MNSNTTGGDHAATIPGADRAAGYQTKGKQPANVADGNGKRVICITRGDPKAQSRLLARLTPEEWRGVVAACVFGSRTPEQVIKAAVRHELTRLGIIQEPKIEPGEESQIKAENRVTVISRNGGILRQFVSAIPAWAFDALQFMAENDGAPIGQTVAAAIYHAAAHRGIKPPRKHEATVAKIITRAKIDDDVPDMILDERGNFRRLLYLKPWERAAACAVANQDGVAIGRVIVRALRYYVAKVRGVEPPPEMAESVENVPTARDCAFLKLTCKGRPAKSAAPSAATPPADAEPSDDTPPADAAEPLEDTTPDAAAPSEATPPADAATGEETAR